MTSEEIMKLAPGRELNDRVIEVIYQLDIDPPGYVGNCSIDYHHAMTLFGIIEQTETVGIMSMGVDAPKPIRHLATIGDTSYEQGEQLFVYTADWRESLCKAFLLWQAGYRGDHYNPVWTEAMKRAPKQVIN